MNRKPSGEKTPEVIPENEITQDNFIRLVTHDLRTPLTVIIGSIYTAMSENISPEDRQRLLQNAVEAAESLANKLDVLQEMCSTDRKSRKRIQKDS